mmetsp:Transcript_8638/g.10372  ORF Transcript_8638/g.10372 Transcript_8638/m.10372 type:complete len:211 (-) Transcript_8638:245-877(-)
MPFGEVTPTKSLEARPLYSNLGESFLTRRRSRSQITTPSMTTKQSQVTLEEVWEASGSELPQSNSTDLSSEWDGGETDSNESENSDGYFYTKSITKPSVHRSSLSAIFKNEKTFGASSKLDKTCRPRTDSIARSKSDISIVSRHCGFRKCIYCNGIFASAHRTYSVAERWKYCSGECHVTHLARIISRKKAQERERAAFKLNEENFHPMT